MLFVRLSHSQWLEEGGARTAGYHQNAFQSAACRSHRTKQLVLKVSYNV